MHTALTMRPFSTVCAAGAQASQWRLVKVSVYVQYAEQMLTDEKSPLMMITGYNNKLAGPNQRRSIQRTASPKPNFYHHRACIV